MQVSNPNDVKIYNLSAGKSLPDWLTDQKKRKLLKKDVDIQRKIELLQDFEMPTVCKYCQITPDGEQIIIAGTYKPRVRCYDVRDMSMKFERGLDAEVVKFRILSNDYSKLLFLQDNRYIEFHTQFGRHYRTRIPKYGRDFDYHHASCDVYFVGIGQEIFRLNLEQGQYMSPLMTSGSEINCCQFNPDHYLFSCGTKEGNVECWDPRSRSCAGILDCALSNHIKTLNVGTFPSVTALKYRNALNIAVGMSTGHVLLYDIRSNKPLLVKDHQYDLPIRDIEFKNSMDLVISMDKKIVKMWDQNTGKPFTAIEPGTDLNNLCPYQNSGLFFIANEAPKMLSYYVPALGTAPKWCSFLDNLTEELEESDSAAIYDDYKFVTRKELEELGLGHLIGSNLVKAYMHGFFLDVRLYNKAKSIVEPFAYDLYKKSKVKEKIEQARANRVRLNKLPKVNTDLAERLNDIDESVDTKNRKAKKSAEGLLRDDRFSAMFKNPDFQIDKESEDYRLLNPVLSKLEKEKKKKKEKELIEEQFDEVVSDSSSSDDEHTWSKEEKLKMRKLKKEYRQDLLPQTDEASSKFYELKAGEDFKNMKERKRRMKEAKKTLSERLEAEHLSVTKQTSGSVGNREMTFTWKKHEKETRRQQDNKLHHRERKKLRRSAHEITGKIQTKPKFWMGKRVQ